MHAIREYADEDRLDVIAEALEPPNRWDSIRAAPTWWVSEDDAWSEFQGQLTS
jgi:hypothetical protein